MLQCKDPGCDDCSGNAAVCKKCVAPGYGLVAGACKKVWHMLAWLLGLLAEWHASPLVLEWQAVSRC